MEWEEAASGFAAMGSEARLKVLRCLIRAGQSGLMVQEVQERTGLPPSTLAHHLKFLAGAGVVIQEKMGRATLNRADFTRLRQLADFILSECCSDQQREAANDG
ncbi:helix-turn-helix domain-containing protein [Phaeobacter sp. QD34_3]|uniref:ArsR/SmtB family transcription factor n=1 Tax=unclassified Phaeobacter TaxID=2621772 RepID=UPI00237FB761|nr:MULTISPECIES: helix-turn-helix domain-containing protein [unclassified Phaeobacter]MDE4132641.1 helix-turn-helix domain-containing protein [Phaeobacter sp. QD34_3]MDE4136277.1 helix-turn-helix domain-containing protein [Phaeobacter sp. QD34_24]MDE4174363.1 helix-turn-helix domain-containing protein [Phaeobacter sp. PT47_59]